MPARGQLLLQRNARALEKTGGVTGNVRAASISARQLVIALDASRCRAPFSIIRTPFTTAQKDQTSGERKSQRTLSAHKPRLKTERSQGRNRAASFRRDPGAVHRATVRLPYSNRGLRLARLRLNRPRLQVKHPRLTARSVLFRIDAFRD